MFGTVASGALAETLAARRIDTELSCSVTQSDGSGPLRASSTRCRDCGRTPLTGERLHVYTRGHRVCELCRPLRREAPQRTELVRGGEAGATVRVQVTAR